MNLNLVVITGRLAVEPEELPEQEDASRILLTVTSPEPPRRVDLIPIIAPRAALPDGLTAGEGLWVVGCLQRRFSSATGRSRLEIMARQVEPKPG